MRARGVDFKHCGVVEASERSDDGNASSDEMRDDGRMEGERVESRETDRE